MDSLTTPNGAKLREIEEYIFHNLVKGEVEKETGSWDGTESQNLLADRKIAAGVRSSLKNYESNSNAYDFDGSYFKF